MPSYEVECEVMFTQVINADTPDDAGERAKEVLLETYEELVPKDVEIWSVREVENERG